MGKDLSDIIAGAVIRHAALALFTGGVGNILAAAGDVMDVMDAMDVLDAADATDTFETADGADAADTTNNASQSSGNGQVHFGSSENVETTHGPANIDDHGNVTTIPQSGTDVAKQISPNDVIKP